MGGFVAAWGWLAYGIWGSYIIWLDAQEYNSYCAARPQDC